MWHLAIPIPNWTGFVLGFVVGFLVFCAWGIWLNRRERKKLKKAQQKAFEDMGLLGANAEPSVQEISKRYLDDEGARTALQKKIEKSQTD